MKFKLDENVPALVHATLVGSGHDAHTVAEEQLAGANDDAVLEASLAEGRVLITLDLDFSDIRAYPPGSHLESGCSGQPHRRSVPLTGSFGQGFASRARKWSVGSCG